MRRPALFAVVVSASALVAGCIETEEKAASDPVSVGAVQPDAVDAVAATSAPPEQIGSCVEQMKFGAYTENAVWTQVWNDVGQTDAGASSYCTQLGANNPTELVRIHEGWLQTQTFLAAAEAAPEPQAASPVAPAQPAGGNCDPSYPDVCIPPAPPDLDCGDIPFRRFTVLPPDPHGFDGGNDNGIGCES